MMGRDETRPRRPTIICVDDDTAIREGLRFLIPAVDVLATYSRVEQLLALLPPSDLVLLDLHLRAPDEDPTSSSHGMRGVQHVVAAGYRVLIYTNERRREVLAICLAAGAAGVVHKAEPVLSLQQAIVVVAQGGAVIPTTLVGLVEKYSTQGRLGPLPPRQVEVLRARARGEPYKSIARRLGIDQRTVEEHMYEVTRRFGDFLRSHSAADLERELGVGPGDLIDLG